MSKYSSEFKLKVVQYCLEEHHGYQDAEKYFKVNHELLRGWIKKYLSFVT
jgi:transposase-like protein